eukprot:TRINITY_DN11813_c0_g1_i2.p1 TRINITY_DN11813_c0_g1~~TRINITY_DN11813_c0_g1_i2.p1  ORF type:complete len:181 (-),score=3.62 TRINITY_DN11813_c0_g1_i2:46-588(-)
MALSTAKDHSYYLQLNNYGLVMLTAAALITECWFQGFPVIFARRKHFNNEFMEKNFKEEHTKSVSCEVPVEGYPDTGSGRYSQKLSYKNWLEFNSVQRAQLNFVEVINFIVPATLIAGVKYPLAATMIGGTHLLGRILYSRGYRSKGPRGRFLGAILNFASVIGQCGLAFAVGLLIYLKK